MPDVPQLQYYPNTLVLPFTYLISSGLIAANGNVQVNLVMAADCSFELLAILGSCTADADDDVIPNNFSLAIQDQSTGRNMMNTRIPQRMLVGVTYNGMPYEKYPVRFPPNCNLLFDFLNLTADNNTIQVALKGYKLYGGS